MKKKKDHGSWGERSSEDSEAGVNAVIYRICHCGHVCYKFPDCSNSHNEVTNCTVSYQHFGVQGELLRDAIWPAVWIIRGQPQPPNITLMQMSLWLWLSLYLLKGDHLWVAQIRGRTARDHLRLVIIQTLQPWYKHLWSSLPMKPSSPSSLSLCKYAPNVLPFGSRIAQQAQFFFFTSACACFSEFFLRTHHGN